MSELFAAYFDYPTEEELKHLAKVPLSDPDGPVIALEGARNASEEQNDRIAQCRKRMARYSDEERGKLDVALKECLKMGARAYFGRLGNKSQAKDVKAAQLRKCSKPAASASNPKTKETP